ncbi:PREDICTED: nicotianamine synthase 1-like [Camelina sativa]|uniref:Nicotianamine synthase n=1 Tax=Camelina sativa TaxID=90675 RepID=A0ABM1RBP9_CAMSA|nr:PREDICTED: nicotianamine synthase 1-like [Camelina sativa]
MHLYVPKIAFVGSGLIPLSPIILAKTRLPNTMFHNFDIDPQANALASRLISGDPDLSTRMIFHTTDLLKMTKEVLSDYDVVFVAALVGLDKKAKVKAIEHLEKHMAPGSLLMLRSRHGLRAFLYHIVDPCDLKGFEVLTIYHPMTNAVVNSVVVARKLGGQTTTVMDSEVRSGQI